MLNLIPIQYRIAFKTGILLIWSLAVFGAGVYVQALRDTNIAQKLEIKTNKQALDDAEKIRTLTKENMLKDQESHAYASFINEEYNDSIQELHSAKSDIDSLTSANSRLRQRSLCNKNSSSGLSKNSDTGVHDQATGDDETGFSREFLEFLESQYYRDDKNVIWATKTVKALNGDPKAICYQSNVICEK